MDNRFLSLLLAMGVSPGVYAGPVAPGEGVPSESVRIPVGSLRLHYETKLILAKLKESGALSIVESPNGPHVIIHGDRIDKDFYEFLSAKRNVTKAETSHDLIISDSLAAALSAFGELNDITPSVDDQKLLEELQNKIGTGLDESMKTAVAGSFA